MVAQSKPISLMQAPKKRQDEDAEEKATRLTLVGVASRHRGLFKDIVACLKNHPESMVNVFALLKDLGCVDAKGGKVSKKPKRALADDKNITHVGKLYVSDLVAILSYLEKSALSAQNLKPMLAMCKKELGIVGKTLLLQILEFATGISEDEPLEPDMRDIELICEWFAELNSTRGRVARDLCWPIRWTTEHGHYWVLVVRKVVMLFCIFHPDGVELWPRLPAWAGRPKPEAIEIRSNFSFERAWMKIIGVTQPVMCYPIVEQSPPESSSAASLPLKVSNGLEVSTPSALASSNIAKDENELVRLAPATPPGIRDGAADVGEAEASARKFPVKRERKESRDESTVAVASKVVYVRKGIFNRVQHKRLSSPKLRLAPAGKRRQVDAGSEVDSRDFADAVGRTGDEPAPEMATEKTFAPPPPPSALEADEHVG